MFYAPRLSREAAVLDWRKMGLVQGIGVAVVFGLPLVAALLWTLLALLLLRAAEAIPWIGPVVTVGAVLFGAGAVAHAAQLAHERGRVSGEPPGPAAA
jgi:uncharacterized membrane protein YedE/YeeE